MQNNANYNHLIDQITDMVLAKLSGDEYCPTFCRADVERIVDAGAERIGIVLGETATAHDWASLIDHTLLKPEASYADIKKLCDEAAQYGFASVCVNPAWVKQAACLLPIRSSQTIFRRLVAGLHWDCSISALRSGRHWALPSVRRLPRRMTGGWPSSCSGPRVLSRRQLCGA